MKKYLKIGHLLSERGDYVAIYLFGVFTIGEALNTFNPSRVGALRFLCQIYHEFECVILNFSRSKSIDMADVRFVEGYPRTFADKEIRGEGPGKIFSFENVIESVYIEWGI